MIETINQFADKWFAWEFAMLWQISILIAVIAGIDFLIKRWIWPQVRYALWLLILVKLISPPSLTSPASFTAEIPFLAEKVIKSSQAQPPIPVQQPVESHNISAPVAADPSPRNVIPAVSTSHTAAESQPVEAAQPKVQLSWKAYSFIGWFFGVLVLAGWLIIKLARLRREHLQHPQEILPERFNDLLCDVAKRLNLKKSPRVILTKKVCCPAVFGVFRPVLLMSADKFKNLTREDVEHILLHELAHIKRGDLLVHSIYMVLQIAYWFNPLLWLIRKQMQNLRELCCDATVAKILREKTAGYRETLLETARQLLAEPVEPGMGLLGLFENSNWLVDRLRWLEKKTWKNRPLRIFTVFVLVCLMATCVLPMAKFDPGSPTFVIKGTVTDAKTSQPIAGAKVGDNKEYNEGKFCTVTDSNGNYEYKTWYEEHGTIAQADGYKSQLKGFNTKLFGSEKERIIDFALILASEQEDTKVPKEFVGHWKGKAKIIVNWTKQKNLPIDIEIHPDGTVEGKVGDATLVDGKLIKKSWIYTKVFRHENPYRLEADLEGDIIKNEKIKRDKVYISLRVENGKIDGGLGTSGTKTGDKENMILSATDVSLIKILEIISVVPTPPAILKLGEKLHVDVRYHLCSFTDVQIWVRPRTKGRTTAHYKAHGSPFYHKNVSETGIAEGYFFFDVPTIVDEISVEMKDRNTKESQIILYKIDAKWIDANSVNTAVQNIANNQDSHRIISQKASQTGIVAQEISYDEKGRLVAKDMNLVDGWGEAVNGLACGIGTTNKRPAPLKNIGISVAIKNLTPKPVKVAVGDEGDIQMILHDSNGKLVPSLRIPDAEQKGNLEMLQAYEIGCWRLPFKLRKWYDNLVPGEYNLTVKRRAFGKELPLVSNTLKITILDESKSAGQGEGGNDKVIAVVLGKEIFSTDIEPSTEMVEKNRSQMTEDKFKKWLKQYRESELRRLILPLLFQNYAKSNKIEVTESEIEEFSVAMNQQLAKQNIEGRKERDKWAKELDNPAIDPNRKVKIESQIKVFDKILERREQIKSNKTYSGPAKMVIEAWKISKSLFEEYGGRVIFQQGGPEPLDAYREFLKQEEKAKRFEIKDKQTADLFWNYFINDKMHTFYSNVNEAERYMRTPWWLMDNGQDTQSPSKIKPDKIENFGIKGGQNSNVLYRVEDLNTIEKSANKKIVTDNSLEVINIDPTPPAILKLGEKLYVNVRYQLRSFNDVQIWVRPRTKGRTTVGYKAHGSEFYHKRDSETGIAEGYFFFDAPTIVDEISVEMKDRNTKESQIILYKIDAKWIDANSVNTAGQGGNSNPNIKEPNKIKDQWYHVTKSDPNTTINVKQIGHIDGSIFYNNFTEDYLRKLIAKSFEIPTEKISNASSGNGSGPQQIHKKIGFEIPFPYDGIERHRRLILYQGILKEFIDKDIRNTLVVLSGRGSGAGELQQIYYNTDSIAGSINIYYSKADYEKDILQIVFTIQEITAESKGNAQTKIQNPIEHGGNSNIEDDTKQLSFGSVNEFIVYRVVDMPSAIDFDTGTLRSDYNSKTPKEFDNWLKSTGIDAVSMYTGIHGLCGFEMVVVPVEKEMWNTSAAQVVRFLAFGKSGTPANISGKGELPATYFLKTREGGMGVLQIIGFSENPDGVKIRYKMIQQYVEQGADKVIKNYW